LKFGGALNVTDELADQEGPNTMGKRGEKKAMKGGVILRNSQDLSLLEKKKGEEQEGDLSQKSVK